MVNCLSDVLFMHDLPCMSKKPEWVNQGTDGYVICWSQNDVGRQKPLDVLKPIYVVSDFLVDILSDFYVF